MDSLAQSFRALGDPTRLRILRLLAQAPLNVSEMVGLMGMAQSSISHHLGKLKRLELICEERAAGYTYYSLALDEKDARWPLVQLARQAEDTHGDGARLQDLLRQREDRQVLNERLLEPGQSWLLWVSALAALLPRLEVADFGCGTGVLSVAIARWARRVVAIDRDASALGQARECARHAGVKNIDFLQEDLHHLSLPAGEQDLVVISQSLHHVEEPKRVLGEAARILRPDGRLVVLELLPHEERWVVERLGHRHLGFEPQMLEDGLKRAGFAQTACETHGRDGGAPFRVFMVTAVRKRAMSGEREQRLAEHANGKRHQAKGNTGNEN